MADFRWLIEAPGPRYLTVQHLTGAGMRDFKWTADHNEALCFKSEDQADRVMMAIRQLSKYANLDTVFGGLFAFEAALGDARAVEHGWTAEHKAQDAMLAAIEAAINWFTPPSDARTTFPLAQLAAAAAIARGCAKSAADK